MSTINALSLAVDDRVSSLDRGGGWGSVGEGSKTFGPEAGEAGACLSWGWQSCWGRLEMPSAGVTSCGVFTCRTSAGEYAEWLGATAGSGAIVVWDEVVATAAAGVFCDTEAEGGKGETGVRGVGTRAFWCAGVAGRAGSGRNLSASLLVVPESMT